MRITINQAAYSSINTTQKLSSTVQFPSTYSNVMTFNKIHYNQREGAGGLAIGLNPLYYGCVVYMRAKAYLSLCNKDNLSVQDKSTKEFEKFLRQGGSISSPTLIYDMLKNSIVGHEGRHRVLAILQLYGNIVLQVHLKLHNKMPSNSIDLDFIEAFNYYCKSESGKVVEGAILAFYTAKQGLTVLGAKDKL